MNPFRELALVEPIDKEVSKSSIRLPYPTPSKKWADPLWIQFYMAAIQGAAHLDNDSEIRICDRAERIADESWCRHEQAVKFCIDVGGPAQHRR